MTLGLSRGKLISSSNPIGTTHIALSQLQQVSVWYYKENMPFPFFFLNKACSSVLFSDSRWLPTSEKFPADLAGELTRKSLIDVVSLDILTNQRNENLKEMATLVF